MTTPQPAPAKRNETPELLPCPFCGGDYIPDHPKMRQVAPMTSKPCLEELTDNRGWRVCCYGCGVQTWNNLKATRPEAVAIWNTRHAPPVPVAPARAGDDARLDKLEERLVELAFFLQIERETAHEEEDTESEAFFVRSEKILHDLLDAAMRTTATGAARRGRGRGK